MAVPTKIVRMTLATVKVRFYASTGLPAVPASAAIRMRYRDLGGEAVLVEDDMTLDGSIYKFPFDTTPCAPGMVSGSIQAPGAEPVAVDFSFEVTANPANMP